jgi:hypothetical protein
VRVAPNLLLGCHCHSARSQIFSHTSELVVAVPYRSRAQQTICSILSAVALHGCVPSNLLVAAARFCCFESATRV